MAYLASGSTLERKRVCCKRYKGMARPIAGAAYEGMFVVLPSCIPIQRLRLQLQIGTWGHLLLSLDSERYIANPVATMPGLFIGLRLPIIVERLRLHAGHDIRPQCVDVDDTVQFFINGSHHARQHSALSAGQKFRDF